MTTDRKYKLVAHNLDTHLFQIKALRDGSTFTAGELGGWIWGERALSHSGECWVANGAEIRNFGSVTSNAYVTGNTIVDGSTIGSDAIVSGREDDDSETTRITITNSYMYGTARVTGGVAAVTLTNSSLFDGVQVAPHYEMWETGLPVTIRNTRLKGTLEVNSGACIDGGENSGVELWGAGRISGGLVMTPTDTLAVDTAWGPLRFTRPNPALNQGVPYLITVGCQTPKGWEELVKLAASSATGTRRVYADLLPHLLPLVDAYAAVWAERNKPLVVEVEPVAPRIVPINDDDEDDD